MCIRDRALIHGRGANIIKVVSLGLGLTMSILLFSRVVYEQSFDTCFKDHQNSIRTCKDKADNNPNNKRAVAMLRTVPRQIW